MTPKQHKKKFGTEGTYRIRKQHQLALTRGKTVNPPKINTSEESTKAQG